MLDKLDFGVTVIYCDCTSCTSSVDDDGCDGYHSSYTDINSSLRQQGWSIVNEDGDWCHYCEDCKKKD